MGEIVSDFRVLTGSHSAHVKMSPQRDICRDKRDKTENANVPPGGHFGTSPCKGMSKGPLGDGRDIFRVGEIAVFRGQRYEVIGVRDHVRGDGSSVPVVDFKTSCPDCGSAFEVFTKLDFRDPRRRCDACKSPGKKVGGHGPGRVPPSPDCGEVPENGMSGSGNPIAPGRWAWADR